MITCINAETLQPETVVNPDDERHVKAEYDGNEDGEMMWERSLKEDWGAQSLTVFRSRMLQKLVWKFRKANVWVVYNKYDCIKEDEDASYADMINQMMSRPPEAYTASAGSIVTTTTTTTTTTTVVPPMQKKRKRTTQKSSKETVAKDEVFVPPSLVSHPPISAADRIAIEKLAKNYKGVLDPSVPVPAAAAAPAPAPDVSTAAAAAPAPAPDVSTAAAA
ncbi:MAG: hypothetical protein CL608_29840, partial [Anaerolineaceae bacterium]|nr:hypothetical protein [Anaerolineaceae bacterium]